MSCLTWVVLPATGIDLQPQTRTLLTGSTIRLERAKSNHYATSSPGRHPTETWTTPEWDGSERPGRAQRSSGVAGSQCVFDLVDYRDRTGVDPLMGGQVEGHHVADHGQVEQLGKVALT